jgi:hypothetical protein
MAVVVNVEDIGEIKHFRVVQMVAYVAHEFRVARKTILPFLKMHVTVFFLVKGGH